MPDRSYLSPAVRTFAAGVVVFLTASCGGYGAVDVDPFTTESDTADTCSALLDDLPQVVDDAIRRDVSPADLPAAAWGQPAIVLRCGVSMPEEFDAFASCHVTNGVGWFVPESQVEDQQADVVMTTVGRVQHVQVVVPARYRPPAAAMVFTV